MIYRDVFKEEQSFYNLFEYFSFILKVVNANKQNLKIFFLKFLKAFLFEII